jgi:hypothetical protein
MTDLAGHSPRRYFVDEHGQRVLIGLNVAETLEFETLDGLQATGGAAMMLPATARFTGSTRKGVGWNSTASTTWRGGSG